MGVAWGSHSSDEIWSEVMFKRMGSLLTSNPGLQIRGMMAARGTPVNIRRLHSLFIWFKRNRMGFMTFNAFRNILFFLIRILRHCTNQGKRFQEESNNHQKKESIIHDLPQYDNSRTLAGLIAGHAAVLTNPQLPPYIL
jgi:hypothetical protein